MAEQALDFRYFRFGDGEARARRRLEVDDELSRVGPREERQPQKREERQRQDENDGEAAERGQRAPQREADASVVDLQKPLEPVVEPDVETIADGPLPPRLFDYHFLFRGRWAV